MKRESEMPRGRNNKRRRTEAAIPQPPQPAVWSWTDYFQGGMHTIAEAMKRPFQRTPPAIPGMEAHRGGSLALLTQQAFARAEPDVIIIDDSSEADPEEARLRQAEQGKQRIEARRHLNDLNPLADIHPGLSKPLFASSFNALNGFADSGTSSPVPSKSHHNIDVEYVPRPRQREWMRSVSPSSSRSSGSTSSRRRGHKSNMRRPTENHQQHTMLDKLVEKAERDGRYDDARKIERARDHLLRSSQAPQLTKVPSRHALESALQKLGFAETRKPLDEAISPPAKTFEPPRTSIKPRKEGKSVERLKNEFVEKLRLDDAEAEKRIKKRLELAKPKVPSRLASDQEAIATARLNDHNFKATLGAAEVDARALRNLNGLNWLNDDVIGFYIEMINARAKAEGRKLVGMNTFFYQKLSENGYTGVKRWTKRMKVDIFALDKFLIPINIGNMHWVCAVINFGEKRIEYYDSMKDSGHRHKVFETLRSYLQSEHKEKKGSEFDLGGWEDHYSPNTPRQHNGSDCGVFACQTLESAARGKDLAVDGFRFTGTNMAFFRKLMVIEIASGELSKRSWDP